MSKYVTYYVIGPEVPDLCGIYKMVPVGECVDGIIYHAIDRENEAAEYVWNCPQCYDSAELLLGDYPELDATETVDTEDGPVEVPLLKPHAWC